jgi:hypothetical protein
LAICKYLFGIYYYLKGELDLALEYLQEALTISENLGDSQHRAFVYHIIARVYHFKGEGDTALQFYKDALAIFESLYHSEKYSSLFDLIRLSLDQNNLSQAKKFLTELQEAKPPTPTLWYQLYSLLGEALILKQSSRLKKKIQSQSILEQIVYEKTFDSIRSFELITLAMINLCELLIGELKLSNDPKVWEEAKMLSEQLYTKAQDQHSSSLMCEALLLKARFEIIDGNLEQTIRFMDQARTTAFEKNLTLLMEKIEVEKENFEGELNKWQTLLSQNPSLQERLEYARVQEYLKDVQKMIKLVDFPQN